MTAYRFKFCHAIVKICLEKLLAEFTVLLLIFLQVTVDLDHFPEFKDDAAFTSQMLREQSVFTIPGMVRDISQYCAIACSYNVALSYYLGPQSHPLSSFSMLHVEA